MLDRTKQSGGRGYAVAVWAINWSTFVITAVIFLVAVDRVPGDVVGVGLAAYFGMIGIVGAAYQGKNIAEGWRSGHPPVESNQETS